jgi:hypothetical protein
MGSLMASVGMAVGFGKWRRAGVKTDKSRDGRETIVPRKRVTLAEGRVSVIDKRDGETGRCPHSIGTKGICKQNLNV